MVDKANATPAEPALPPKEGRAHLATYASDKRNPGGYLVRVVGPHATVFAGRHVPVTRKDGSESMEHLETAVWAGMDDERKQPVALYRFTARPRDEQTDDLPF